MRLRDLFRRRPRDPFEGYPDSVENWAAGDIALCVGRGQWESVYSGMRDAGPASGQMVRVKSVNLVEGRQFLLFALWPGRCYAAHSFVKARPDAHEACDVSFGRQLKRLRPKVLV